MLPNLLKNKKFKSEVRKFYNKHKKKILDIVLYGSVIRGKEKPKDIDILIIFKDVTKKEYFDLPYELRKNLEKLNLKPQVFGNLYKELFSVEFLAREDILSDGYSLIYNKSLSGLYGYKTFMLFKYSLKGFSESKRVRFHYALEGRRKQRGMIKTLKGIKFTSAVVLVPIENSENFKNFLDEWKVKNKKTRILIPEKVLKFTRF